MRATLVIAAMIGAAGMAGSAFSQPADATNGAFDGTYVGGLTQTSKNCLSGSAAADPTHVRLPVKNGAFPWTINKVRTMVPIGKDGEIATKTPYIELRGRAVGRVLEWDSINQTCFNKWHFEKQ
jgi:hypothetical protein